MWTHGRARALTVATPMRPFASRLQRAVYHVERSRVRSIHHRSTPMGLIYAIRWSVVPRNPVLGISRPQMVFLSNFVGDWDDYIDVFVAVHRVGLLLHFFGVKGFPSLGEARLVKEFIRDRDREPLTYLSAYPDASARDLAQLLERHRGPLAADPRWVTVLHPLLGDAPAAAAAARSMREVLALDGVHFARVAQLRFDGPPVLLLSLVVDPAVHPDDESLFRTLLDRGTPAQWTALLGSDDRTTQVRRLLDGRLRERHGLSWFVGGGLRQHDISTALARGDLLERA